MKYLFEHYIEVVLSILIAIAIIRFIINAVKFHKLFKRSHNPYYRICKKCGSHQSMYQSNIEGCENDVWWERVYPLGNDEKCQCHSYTIET